MAGAVDDSRPEIGITGARFGGVARRPHPALPDPGTAPELDPDSPVGLTGARFGDAARRAHLAPPDPATARERDPDPAVGLTGARFGGAARQRRHVPSADAPPPPPPDPAAAPAPEVDDPGPPPQVERSIGARPYVLTGGRTRPRVHFAIEALITSTPGPGPVGESLEHARIRELCRTPCSVAEVAALRGVPLGVARVLLADLLAAGGVTVHRTAAAGGPDDALLERVLAGLRRL